MNVRAIPRRLVVYALLIGGSIVFTIPFVWMVFTSIKTDRELYPQEFRLTPLPPHPAGKSPYIDPEVFASVDGPHLEAMIPGLIALVQGSGFVLPKDVDSEAAWRGIALGLYEHLRGTLSPELWERPPDVILAEARRRVRASDVAVVFSRIYRHLRLGQIRIRSRELVDIEVGAGEPMVSRLQNQTPQQASVGVCAEDGVQCSMLAYDFAEGDRVVLTRTVELPFEASQLQRVQLHLCPDDTWHELYLTVQSRSTRYESEKAQPLANYVWQTVTWQPPSLDDESPTKIKSWIRLRESESPADDLSPRQVRLTLELRKVTPAGAWHNKLWMNYDRVLGHVPFWRYLTTSLFLVITNIVLTLFSCSLVAYAFARLQWPGRDLCFVLMLATMMVPAQVLMIPQFLIWKWLGAYNTLTPLWLSAAFGNAFFIFLLRQFLKGIPRDLEDAARIDGCGFWRIYWHIMLPLIKPSLAAIAIFTFMATWNDFTGPLLYLADQRLYPLAFGLYAFSVQVGNSPQMTMAGSLLMTLPVILIFFLAQKYFIQGITLTGMKG